MLQVKWLFPLMVQTAIELHREVDLEAEIKIQKPDLLHSYCDDQSQETVGFFLHTEITSTTGVECPPIENCWQLEVVPALAQQKLWLSLAVKRTHFSLICIQLLGRRTVKEEAQLHVFRERVSHINHKGLDILHESSWHIKGQDLRLQTKISICYFNMSSALFDLGVIQRCQLLAFINTQTLYTHLWIPQSMMHYPMLSYKYLPN